LPHRGRNNERLCFRNNSALVSSLHANQQKAHADVVMGTGRKSVCVHVDAKATKTHAALIFKILRLLGMEF